MKMTKEHKKFLNDLRESGAVNMFGSSLYLAGAFPELTSRESRQIVVEWMETFSKTENQ